MTDRIFVFGSNLGGIHGAGAASVAHRHHLAQWGVGVGHTGNSYAIPTKDGSIENRSVGKTLPKWAIQQYVEQFKQFARMTPETEFKVTCIGCGLAGLKHKDIAPMFIGSPNNCSFDTLWKPYLGNLQRYWGTY